MSQYVPPSDPEDNDCDYEDFELFRTNQAEEIFDYSDDDGENQEYATLEVHNPNGSQNEANSHPNVNQPPSQGAHADETAPNMDVAVAPQPSQDAPVPNSNENAPNMHVPVPVAAPLSPPNQDVPVRDSNENAHDMDPPPPLSPNLSDSNSPVNSESENEDSDLDLLDPLDTDDDFGIPLERPPSRPMVNYSGDVEVEEDYEIGWEWLEHDTGPIIGPYSGFRQCLVDPEKNKPEDFFNAVFDDRMFTIMAEMTNLYAHNRLRSK